VAAVHCPLLAAVMALAGPLGVAPWSTQSAATAATPGSSPATLWLCRPGQTNNPCQFPHTATAVTASGSRSLAPMSGASAATKFDCFYVYPTVSQQKTANANLRVQQTEVAAAVAQASQFSQVCSVWAPMYRQQTSSSIAAGISGSPGTAAGFRAAATVAYLSLLSGWNDFVAHDDDGKPIILIGHSQGSAMLIRLIANRLDHDPSILRRLVVAIIPGGNLQVPTGRTVGATFSHVPLCTGPQQTGCAIAYSTFPSQPPPTALFGRSGQGVSLQSGQTTKQGEQVACVNPAALAGGTADLSPLFVAATQGLLRPVRTPWVTFPDLYAANCVHQGGASWLQVTSLVGPGDTRPTVTESLGPTWGYHGDDVNLALGDLVRDVVGEEAGWTSAHG
jgi:Protein of unknown function (DUF3089)